MQTDALERKFEQERKVFRLHISELEKKLDGLTHDLTSCESNLVLKDKELHALQSNLKELDDLREMKEVLLYVY